MKIGLQLVGSDSWIGGVYYIHNLVRALRSLPKAEQPDVALLVPEGAKAKHYRPVESLVELVRYAPSISARVASTAGNKTRGWFYHNPRILSLARWVERLIGGRRNRGLRSALESARVSVLFPCTRSMGKDFPIPWIGWAWDLQHRYLPKLFEDHDVLSRDRALTKLASEAPLVVASSKNALADFKRFFPNQRAETRVLRFFTVPLPEWYRADVFQTLQRMGLPDRYLAVCNQFWVHKDHRVVFEAVKLLVEAGVNVHVVCTGDIHDYRDPGYFPSLREYIRRNHLTNRIHILGLVPRLDQIQIMRGAMAVVQPSRFEGWSTVVEDVRLLGKRAFLSDIGVHREQNPPNAVYFKCGDAKMLADTIRGAWDSLTPGPVLAAEERALAAQHELVVEYARRFLRIATDVVG